MSWEECLPEDIKALYEIHDFKHAAVILKHEFPVEFAEVCNALRLFKFSIDDVTAPGGNESQIPKKFSNLLRPLGWQEKQMKAEMKIDEEHHSIDTHKVDYLKGRVAFDLEWNSKDQTFDRDLYAFKAFFDYSKISLGILVTRSNELDAWFKSLNLFGKYGASTTHMGKLLPRLKAGRNGGCPVLVFGITTKLLSQ